jgi:methionyl-tRNA formyltransferase
MKPRVLFFGTPEIAVPTLRALHEVATVVAVVCQPDKPAGRDPSPQPPATKRAAIELGLPVHQPVKVRVPEFAAWVREQQADAGLVFAYGRILTREVLDIPRVGCLNLHASILPRYRGAAPINWAIVRGERETGISLMQMDEGIDTGPVLATRSLPIGPDETAESLARRLAELGAEMTRAEVLAAIRGELSPTPQDHSAATMAPILDREHGRIDWTRQAQEIHDQVRGFFPWPGASTTARGKALKIIETSRAVLPAVLAAGGEPGEVRQGPGERLWVRCGDGFLEVVRAQLEGRKALGGPELFRGRAVEPGQRLGG